MVDTITAVALVNNLIVAPWVNAIVISIIAAITLAIAFVVGYYVANFVVKIIKMALERAKLEQWIDDHNLGSAMLGFRVTQIIGVWVKVFVITAAIGTGFALIQTDLPVVEVINDFLSYLGTLASSLIIIGGALFIAKYVSNQVKEGDFLFSTQVAGAIYIAIAYFVVVATLPSLLPGAGARLAELLFTLLLALVAGVGLAIGLAFGLGLKDVISKSALKNQAAIEKYVVKLGKK